MKSSDVLLWKQLRTVLLWDSDGFWNIQSSLILATTPNLVTQWLDIFSLWMQEAFFTAGSPSLYNLISKFPM